jgi:dynactin complex subunit
MSRMERRDIYAELRDKTAALERNVDNIGGELGRTEKELDVIKQKRAAEKDKARRHS